MADIITPSDQQVTKILKVLDRLEEKQQKEYADLQTRVAEWDQVWKDGRARLEDLERRASAGLASPNLPVPEHRKDMLREWVADQMCRAFVKNYQTRTHDFQTIGDDGADNVGGAVVPEPLQPEVIRIVEQYGLVRRLFTQVPMTADTLDLNSLVGGTGSGAGITVLWKDEAVAATNSRAKFLRKTLNASKLIALNEMSLELTADSAIPIANFLLELFGEAIAKKEDTEGLIGDTNGGDEFDGVATEASGNITLASGSSDIADITYDDVVDLMGEVNDFVQETGVFVFSSKVLRHLRKLREDVSTGDGALLWSPMASTHPATILGRPYYISPVMPGDGAGNNVVIYGDFSKTYMGIRSGFEVAFSEDVGFAKATRVMRVMERIAFKTVIPEAFATLTLGAA